MPVSADLQIDNALPQRRHTASAVSLFLYNAAVWNPHRIHYDERYARDEEHHPGIIIDGPLQGDWLTQVVLDWLGDSGRLLEVEYSNRRAAVLGETLTAGGRIVAIDGTEVELELWVSNDRGEVTAPGRARVELAR